MDYCKECGFREIFNKERDLCQACYMRFYRKKPTFKKTPASKKARIIRRLRKKYGIQFIKDIKALKTQQYLSLHAVGVKYGLTRERVRQIFKKIYNESYGKYETKKAKERKESEATVCVNDPRRKVADYKKDSDVYKGALAEKLFMEQCESLGFNVEIPCGKSFDIIINGFIVDVKSCTSARKMSDKNTGEYYNFSARSHQRTKCDFFACYIVERDVFYIIPNPDKGVVFEKARSFYISKEKTDYYNSKNAHHEHKNMFSYLAIPKQCSGKKTQIEKKYQKELLFA